MKYVVDPNQNCEFIVPICYPCGSLWNLKQLVSRGGAMLWLENRQLMEVLFGENIELTGWFSSFWNEIGSSCGKWLDEENIYVQFG